MIQISPPADARAALHIFPSRTALRRFDHHHWGVLLWFSSCCNLHNFINKGTKFMILVLSSSSSFYFTSTSLSSSSILVKWDMNLLRINNSSNTPLFNQVLCVPLRNPMATHPVGSPPPPPAGSPFASVGRRQSLDAPTSECWCPAGNLAVFGGRLL